jgi:hypothetical protein
MYALCLWLTSMGGAPEAMDDFLSTITFFTIEPTRTSFVDLQFTGRRNWI